MKSKSKKLPIFCEECAWKLEEFEGITPCEICIRNPKLMSKRFEGPKEVTIKAQRIKVPRDFYISQEMLEVFKLLLKNAYEQIEALRKELWLKRFKEFPSTTTVPVDIDTYVTWYPIGSVSYGTSSSTIRWKWSNTNSQ